MNEAVAVAEELLERPTTTIARPRAWRAVPGSRPKRLGRYEIVAKIAKGGMATIYLAQSGNPDERTMAAIKVIRHELSQDGHVAGMFDDEAAILARLVHPNIVRMFEFGDNAEHRFIAMELLLGHTLMDVWRACVARRIVLRPEDIAWMGARVAEALHFAHELRGAEGEPLHLVHRDVNPSNIFLTYDGELKLFDFGFAKSTEQRARTAAGIVKGKLPYLSPEQIMQLPLDRRSDLFALGTTLWEMATTRRLFAHADDATTVQAVRSARIPDPRVFHKTLPEDLAAIILRALARNRAERYASAGDMAVDLDEFARARGADDVPERIAAILEMFFPEERAKQLGWLRSTRCG